MSEATFETIIGLEVHVQLLTQSKLFCRCATKFGQAPNTMTCPICTGMPGTLPVLNQHALDLAIKSGIALNCEIPKITKWDRKNYFYPDLPKGYQVSQFDLPITQNGWLEIESPKDLFESKRVGITRAHLEEDAGKSMHDESHGKADSKIDLNRTGTPLLEIVSEPDMRSSAEAKAYLTELKLLLTYLEVSDCNMQEGSLRVDANVNIHIHQNGETIPTPIVEIKNLNSFRAVERALDYEQTRQKNAWLEQGLRMGDVPKQTHLWDDAAGVTKPMRSKEDSADYRYFPDPDLVAYQVDPERVNSIRNEIPELPAILRKRLVTDYKITDYDSDVIVNHSSELVQYFETVAKAVGDGKLTSNWLTQNVLRSLNERDVDFSAFEISESRLTELLTAIQKGTLDKSRAKDVFAAMIDNPDSVEQVMSALGIEQVDAGELEELCRMLLEKNPKVGEDYREGKTKAIGSLIGQAKKANPNVSPDEVRKMLIQLLESQS